MADSLLTCSGLAATPAVEQAILSWSVIDPQPGGLPYLALDKVEVWAASVNDRAMAVKVGEALDSLTEAGLAANVHRYYWVRPRNIAGAYGDWLPFSAVVGLDVVPSSSLPAPGSITPLELAPGAVTEPAMANGAVPSRVLADLAVTRAKLGFASVGGLQVEDASIGYAKIVSVKAYQIEATSLSAISANLGTVTAGTIYGVTINGTVINGGTINSPTINGGYMDVVELTANNIYGARIRTQTLGERIDMSLGQLLVYNSLLQNTIRLGASPFGSTPPMGVLTTNPSAFAATFQNTNAGAIQAVSPTWGVYVTGGGGYGPFTGAHEMLWPIELPLPEPGDLVADCGVVFRGDLSNTLCEGGVSVEGRPVIGAFVQELPWYVTAAMPQDTLRYDLKQLAKRYRLILVNALGEGQINVCNKGGPIKAGDLLCPSVVEGRAAAQADDIVRGKTVAKAREAAVFNEVGNAQIACIYMAG